MAEVRLTHLGTERAAGDTWLEGITDLVVEPGPDGPRILSVTRPGNGLGLAVWELDTAGDGLDLVSSKPLAGAAVTGVEPAIEVVSFDGESEVVTLTGVGGNGLTGVTLDDAGTLGASTRSFATTALPSGLSEIELVEVGSRRFVFGAVHGSDGLERWQVGADGTLGDRVTLSSTAIGGATGMTSLGQVRIDGTPYLLAGFDGATAFAVYSVGPNGTVTQTGRLDVTSGLGIAGAVQVQTTTVAGVTYAVLTGATSNSLSVVEITATGALVAHDHVIDDLGTRFANASHLAITEVNGQSFIAVSGSDDGVSLFQLLPGGYLLLLDTMADSADMTLDAITALAMTATAEAVQIHVASGTEAGITTLEATLGPLGATILGSRGADTLSGAGAGRNVIDGGAGNDRIEAGTDGAVLLDGTGTDTLIGGAGTDIFVLSPDAMRDVITGFDIAHDRIDLSLWPMLRSVSQLTITETATGATITFGRESLTIVSRDGRPIGVAALVADGIISIAHYLPEDPNDTTGPAPAASVSEVLGDDLANRIEGGSGPDRLDGRGGDDTLFGGPGNDILIGGAGADRMVGGNGSDRYWVDAPGDVIVERAGAPGTDTVMSSIDYRLNNFADVENLTLTGTRNLSGFGNALANVITGNDGDNRLEGRLGNDTLIGEGGNDTLGGGAGADRMVGGNGSDRYWVDTPGDQVIEQAGAPGTDTVMSSITYRLNNIADIENLTLTGTRNLNGFGNALANVLTGNDGDNYLAGRDGDDTLIGGGGNDSLFGGAGNDRLFGGAGNDTLIGGDGVDRMVGGTGSDQFVVDETDDVIVEAPRWRGTDTILSSVTYRLNNVAHIENLTLTGAADLDGFGNALANVLTGNAGDNRLEGCRGNDTLIGGDGNDTLVGGSGADAFVFDERPDGTNVDTILDFEPGRDRLMMRMAVFTGIGAGRLGNALFAEGTEAQDANDRFFYDHDSGELWYDPDGTGDIRARLVAEFTTHPDLHAADIFLL
ncbi:Ca2+-binding RTX toxin-like protein [Rhodobacter sp. 140A]|nr:Ca2+-binding RTX toxin-like protein [Rhodobacter sp. 140A]